MRALYPAVFLLAVTASGAETTPFLLTSGDFRWIPMRIRQTPVEVDVSFSVTQGDAIVHAELIADEEFRPMQKGLEHESLASTIEGKSGAFRRIVEEPGNYRIVIVNRKEAQPGMVTLNVSTAVDRITGATELPPRRRMAVIGISLGIFLLMLGFSGWKLRKAAVTEDPPPFEQDWN